MAGETRDQIMRTASQRILIDRPIEAVFKRVRDLRTLAEAIPALRVLHATPDGEVLRGELFMTVTPLRARLVGTGAVLDTDDLAHRATLRIEARDHYGRGKLVADVAVALDAVGSGTEVVLDLDVTLAGALVRFTGDALLADLDGAVRSYFVAIAGDGFSVDEGEPTDALFAPLDDGIQLDDTVIDLTALETEPAPMLGRNEPAVALFRSADEPAVALARIATVLRAEADLVHAADLLVVEPELEPEVVPEVVAVPEPVRVAPAMPVQRSLPSPRPRASARVGLPAESLPRSGGFARTRSRVGKAAQTAGTVAAGAAVVAAVAGAVVARRWFGRR